MKPIAPGFGAPLGNPGGITKEIEADPVVVVGVAVGEMHDALNGVAVAIRPIQHELPQKAGIPGAGILVSVLHTVRLC